MRSLIRSGQHAEALRIYRRLREMLSVVLGVTPAHETEQLRATSSRRSECGHRFDGTSLGLEARPLTTEGNKPWQHTRPTWDEFKAHLEAAIQELVDAQNATGDAQAKLRAAQDRLRDLS